jgi:hypothetical protein
MPFRAPDPKSGASAVPPLSRCSVLDKRKRWARWLVAGDAPDQREAHRTKSSVQGSNVMAMSLKTLRQSGTRISKTQGPRVTVEP